MRGIDELSLAAAVLRPIRVSPASLPYRALPLVPELAPVVLPEAEPVAEPIWPEPVAEPVPPAPRRAALVQELASPWSEPVPVPGLAAPEPWPEPELPVALPSTELA